MLITITNPVGLHAKVQELQAFIHSNLLTKWGISDTTKYLCTGLCYRNKKDEGYIAEMYSGNNEYKDVYWDDTLSALSFFGLSGQIKHDVVEVANVHLVFFVNLAKIKASITHRADEEARNDVLNLVSPGKYGFIYESMDLWLENVLKEYPASWRTAGKYESMKTVDMHPTHCFRLNFSVQYDKNYCTTLKIK
jgi:hypothetical protein